MNSNVSTPSGNDGKAKPCAPSLAIQGGSEKYNYDPSVITAEVAEKLADEIAAWPAGPITLKAKNIAGWAVGSVLGVCLLWFAIRARREVGVRLAGKPYAEPLQVLFAVWEASNDGATAKRALEAVEIIARFVEPTNHHAAAATVASKLNDPQLTIEAILAKLAVRTKPASSAAGTPRPNPTLLARDFLEYHRTTVKGATVATADRSIHYFGGSYFVWDGVWNEVSDADFRPMVVHFLHDRTTVTSVTSSLVNNVLVNLSGLCLVGPTPDPLPFYIDDYKIPTRIRRRPILLVANGLLDFEPLMKGEDGVTLFDNTPRWFGTTQLPYAFDPTSTAKCPKFGLFLRKVLESPDGIPIIPGDNRVSVLQEWFGYTLLPEGRFQKFLLMVGEGSNGKGVIQNLWIRMLGAENVSHLSLDQLRERFALHPLVGKLANICGDLCEIDAVAEGILKRLTGEDNITLDRKNKSLITMSPSVKLIFATNTLPRFTDRSRGIWRRMMVMPFRVVIPEAEQNSILTKELASEMPGILRWAIAGLKRLLAQGHFTFCPVCVSAAHQHQTDCDPVKQFIDEVLEYPPPPGGPPRHCLVGDVYREYREWAETSGFRLLSINSFNREIKKLAGVTKVRTTTKNSAGRRPYSWIGFGKPSLEANILAMKASDPDDEDVAEVEEGIETTIDEDEDSEEVA